MNSQIATVRSVFPDHLQSIPVYKWHALTTRSGEDCQEQDILVHDPIAVLRLVRIDAVANQGDNTVVTELIVPEPQFILRTLVELGPSLCRKVEYTIASGKVKNRYFEF